MVYVFDVVRALMLAQNADVIPVSTPSKLTHYSTQNYYLAH